MAETSRLVFETPFFFIEQLETDNQEGEPYYRLSGADSAIVLVFNHKADVLMVRQFRPTLGEMTLEFPAGAIELTEEPIHAARREVKEETGYRSELIQLGEYFHLMMNRTSIRDYLFCGIAEEQKPAAVRESIDHEWVNRDWVRAAMFNGSYRQLAGIGIIQLASQFLGIDVLNAPQQLLIQRLRTKIRNMPGAEQ